MQNPTFYFSLAAFLISIGSGIYFLVWWLKSGGRYRLLLFWAFGSGSLLWFKIPNIVANASIEVTQTDFYPFFFVTLLIYFLAYFALARGFAFFTQFPHGKLIVRVFAIWFGAAMLYLGLSFLVPSVGVAKAPVWAIHLLFYIPAQLFLLYELWRVVRRPAGQFVVSKTGIVLVAGGIISLVISSILYITTQLGPYPEDFWYFAVVLSSQISFVQVVGGLLLFFGLRTFAKAHIQAALWNGGFDG